MEELEQLRAIIFTGKRLHESESPLTQEEYVERYENQWERDPLLEWQLVSEAAKSLIPLYQKEQQHIERMERMLSGQTAGDTRGADKTAKEFARNEADDAEDEAADSHQDEAYWVERLYDEIVDLETEEEWQKFKKRFRVSSR